MFCQILYEQIRFDLITHPRKGKISVNRKKREINCLIKDYGKGEVNNINSDVTKH